MTVHGDNSTIVQSNIIQRTTNKDSWSIRGYYLAYAGRNLISTAPSVQNMELGVFVDGPEYRTQEPLLQDSNRQIVARYVGNAAGFVGTNDSGKIAGATWDSKVNLLADFSEVQNRRTLSITRVGGYMYL